MYKACVAGAAAKLLACGISVTSTKVIHCPDPDMDQDAILGATLG